MGRGSDELTSAGLRGRNSRLVRGILSSGVVRGVSLVAPLATIPWIYQGTSPATFGVWMTAQSVTGMLLWVDLGLGSGLLTRLSAALADGDELACRRLIGTAYRVLALVAVGLVALVLLVTHGPMDVVLGELSAELRHVLAISLVGFIVTVPLGLIQRVQFALQEFTLSNTLGLVAPCVSIAGVGIAHAVDAPGWAYVLAASAAPAVGLLAATLVTVGRHPGLLPRGRDFVRRAPQGFLSLGLTFLVLQLLSAAITNMDNIVIGLALGASAVADFALVAKVFLILGAVVSLMNMPLWSANAEALRKGDLRWVVVTMRRMMALNFVVMACAAVPMLLGSQRLLSAWAGSEVVAAPELILGFCLFWGALAVLSPVLMVQNASGVVGTQVVGLAVAAALSAVLKFVVARYDPDWVPIVGAGIYLAVMVPCAVLGYRRVRSSAGGHGALASQA